MRQPFGQTLTRAGTDSASRGGELGRVELDYLQGHASGPRDWSRDTDGGEDVLRELAGALARVEARQDLLGLPAALNAAPVGVLVRDPADRVIFANAAFAAISGRTIMPGETCSLAELVDLDNAEAVARARSVSSLPYRLETRIVRPDGSAIWCTVHGAPVPNGPAQPASSIVMVVDRSERHAAEQALRERAEHYRSAMELSPQIAWTAAPDGGIHEVSPRWHDVTGVPEEGALGEAWISTLHPDDVPPTRLLWDLSLASKRPVDVEYRLRTFDGSYRWFRARAVARLDAAGAAICWHGTLEDIHDRRVAEDALRDSEERFRLAAEAAGLGIWDYDALTNKREWSRDFRNMLGLPLDAEPSVATALQRVHPEDRHLLTALVDAAQSGDTSARFEVTLRIHRADTGAERWMRTDGWRMYTASGKLTRVLVTIRDVTEERTVAERIRWTATHDALTRIPNRGHFNERLEQALAVAQPHECLALVVFDVDRLKEINDSIGHDAGDALLRTFAKRLETAFADEVVVGRIGGDEFAVLLRGGSRQDLHGQITLALESLAAPFDYDGNTCDAQATGGVAFYPTDGISATDLLKTADIALYVGKNGARGTVTTFEASMRAGLQRRASMLNVARAAVRDRRILPFYQPKVMLADQKLVGFEALLRWRHDHLGIQTPATINAAFEDLNLAVALSDAMLAQIARDMRAWIDAGLPVGTVAINVSSAEFRHEDLVTRILQPFRRLEVPPELLELEITETVLLDRDAGKVAATLAAFRSEGVQIALDDFGTGFASLTHLKSFPVDTIKIDRSFVAQLCDRADDAAIVDAVLGLAERLSLQVVAEGIESEAQVDYLRVRGCKLGQGYLFGRPMPLDAATQLLAGSPTL